MNYFITLDILIERFYFWNKSICKNAKYINTEVNANTCKFKLFFFIFKLKKSFIENCVAINYILKIKIKTNVV